MPSDSDAPALTVAQALTQGFWLIAHHKINVANPQVTKLAQHPLNKALGPTGSSDAGKSAGTGMSDAAVCVAKMMVRSTTSVLTADFVDLAGSVSALGAPDAEVGP